MKAKLLEFAFNYLFLLIGTFQWVTAIPNKRIWARLKLRAKCLKPADPALLLLLLAQRPPARRGVRFSQRQNCSADFRFAQQIVGVAVCISVSMIRFKMRHGCRRTVGGIKITAEMVAAGAEILAGREWPYENGDEVAQDVFIAMAGCRSQSAHCSIVARVSLSLAESSRASSIPYSIPSGAVRRVVFGGLEGVGCQLPRVDTIRSVLVLGSRVQVA
jgi:hypothetical protein